MILINMFNEFKFNKYSNLRILTNERFLNLVTFICDIKKNIYFYEVDISIKFYEVILELLCCISILLFIIS